jgi:hypothetical protein
MKRKLLFVFLFTIFGLLFINYKVEAKTFGDFYNDYASMNYNQKIYALHTTQEQGNNFYYDTLDENGKEIYDAFLPAIRAGYPFQVVIEDRPEAELQALFDVAFDAWEAFNLDHPEYFWLSNGAHKGRSYLGTTLVGVNVRPLVEDGYLIGGEGGNFNQTLVNEDANHILARRAYLKQEIDLLQNDYRKLRYLYTWLIQNNEYDTDFTSEFAHTPSGALIKSDFGKDGSLYEPVCEAYAEAFQMLANYANLPVITSVGQGYGSSGWEAHAWSHAFLAGKWYFTDVTWGDPTGSHLGEDYVDYDYFLAAPSSEHVIDDEAYLPVPLSNVAFDEGLLNEFHLVTEENYIYSGNPIRGYEELYILDNPTAELLITYFDSDNHLLSEIPSAIGSYTVRARGALGSGYETVTINFSFNILAPTHNTVIYYDKDDNILISIPYNIDSQIPPYEAPFVSGYKFLNWDYLPIEYTVHARPVYKKLEVKFEDGSGNPLEYEFTSVDDLYSTTLLNTIPKEPGYLIMGWEVNGELLTDDSQITDDVTLKPLVQKVVYSIQGMNKKSENVWVGSVFKSDNVIEKIDVDEGVRVTYVELSEIQDGKQTLTMTFQATNSLDEETIVATIEILEVRTFNDILDWVKANYIWVLVGFGGLIVLSIAISLIGKRKKGKKE